MAYGRADAVAGAEAVGAEAAAGAARWFAEASCRGAGGLLQSRWRRRRGPKSGVDGETRAKLAVPAASSLAERNLSAQEGQFRASVGCLRA